MLAATGGSRGVEVVVASMGLWPLVCLVLVCLVGLLLRLSVLVVVEGREGRGVGTCGDWRRMARRLRGKVKPYEEAVRNYRK